MKRFLIGSFVLALMMSFQASAAEEFDPKQAANEEFMPKRNEFSIFGNIDNSTQTDAWGNTSDTAMTYISGHYGRYFTPKLVGSVGVFVMHTETGGTALDFLDVGVGVKYYFIHGKRVSPFIMGDVGVSIMDGAGFSESGFMADVAGGVAFWLTETSALNLDLKLKHDEYTNTSTDHVMVEVGLTTKF